MTKESNQKNQMTISSLYETEVNRLYGALQAMNESKKSHDLKNY